MKIDKKITGWKVNASDQQPIQEILIPSPIDDTLLNSKTYKFKVNEASYYVTLTEAENKPYSIFINSKSKEHLEAIGAITTLVSLLFQSDISNSKVIKALDEMISSGSKAYWSKNYEVEGKKKNYHSLYQEIGAIIKHFISNLELPRYMEQPVDIVREKSQDLKGGEIKFTHVCSACGEKKAILMDGCVTCTECSYSKCS